MAASVTPPSDHPPLVALGVRSDHLALIEAMVRERLGPGARLVSVMVADDKPMDLPPLDRWVGSGRRTVMGSHTPHTPWRRDSHLRG